MDYTTLTELKWWRFTSGLSLSRVIIVEHITGSRWQTSRTTQVENDELPRTDAQDHYSHWTDMRLKVKA